MIKDPFVSFLAGIEMPVGLLITEETVSFAIGADEHVWDNSKITLQFSRS